MSDFEWRKCWSLVSKGKDKLEEEDGESPRNPLLDNVEIEE